MLLNKRSKHLSRCVGACIRVSNRNMCETGPPWYYLVPDSQVYKCVLLMIVRLGQLTRCEGVACDFIRGLKIGPTGEFGVDFAVGCAFGFISEFPRPQIFISKEKCAVVWPQTPRD